jgi:hypothetical protein
MPAPRQCAVLAYECSFRLAPSGRSTARSMGALARINVQGRPQFAPKSWTASAQRAKSVVFVVDESGSMGSDRRPSEQTHEPLGATHVPQGGSSWTPGLRSVTPVPSQRWQTASRPLRTRRGQAAGARRALGPLPMGPRETFRPGPTIATSSSAPDHARSEACCSGIAAALPRPGARANRRHSVPYGSGSGCRGGEFDGATRLT